jgi:hypothetical protein
MLILLSGLAFEKYAIKYLLGLVFVEDDCRWYPNGSEPHNPPAEALNALYNNIPLEYPMGLYYVSGPGQVVKNEHRVGMVTMREKGSGIVLGGRLNFRNHQFVILLCDGDLSNSTFNTRSGALVGPNEKLKVEYHVKRIEVTARGKISGVINFDWNI